MLQNNSDLTCKIIVMKEFYHLHKIEGIFTNWFLSWSNSLRANVIGLVKMSKWHAPPPQVRTNLSVSDISVLIWFPLLSMCIRGHLYPMSYQNDAALVQLVHLVHIQQESRGELMVHQLECK